MTDSLNYPNLAQRLVELERLREEVRRSQMYLSEAQRLSHTGSWEWRVQTGEFIWSVETYHIFECDPAVKPTLEMILERIHPEDRTLVLQALDQSSSAGTDFDYENRLLFPDGRIKYLHVLAKALGDPSDGIEFAGAVMDVTQAKHAEERIRQSEQELRTTVETIPALIHTARPDGYLDFFNRNWLSFVGAPTEALLGWKWTSYIHPEDVEAFVEKWRESIATGKDLQSEARVRRADGEYRWMVHRTVPLRDEHGGVAHWYGSSIDIEDQKRAEEAIRQSEAQLLQLIDAIPQQVLVFGPDWSPLFVNVRTREYTGLSLEEAQGKDAFARVHHPDDLQKLQNARARAKIDGVPIEIESRIRRYDGQYRWFLIRYNALRDEQGQILRWYATRTDIEDRKQAEETIRQSEAEVRQLLDASPQHLGVLGPDGSRIFLNQAGLDYHGWTIEWWRTCDRRSLFHPDDWERVDREIQKAFSTGSMLEVETRGIRQDGVYRWLLLRYKPLRNEQGQITHWAYGAVDIDDRKRAEERLQHENVALREEIDQAHMFEEIVGASPAIRAVLSRVAKVAPTDSTVLITGETGTGKELIARAIHKRSQRSKHAFVSVSCATIPRDLIASELFGHEKGSFTGATQRRVGRFELAEGGTIFLDEIGELPAETQIALLRVLQEREFERVGGNQVIRADVRVIAATNRDLQAAIAAGSFRDDLFYRLSVLPIEIPPLRERRADIPLLVEYFIDRFARKAGKTIRSVNRKSLDLLQAYSWPGNIRELQNVIERSVILSDSENLSIDESWVSRQFPSTGTKDQPELSLRLAAEERKAIEAALTACEGRVSGPLGAAARLGMPRSTLESKIRSLKIEKHRFQAGDRPK